MPKFNTLFNYFGKSPSPKTSTKKSASPTNNARKAKENGNACKFELYSLAWAKLEGYPWWPSIVCNHPKKGIHFEGGRKASRVHVQFFDDPPSRGWVKEKKMKVFMGLDNMPVEIPKCKNDAWKQGVELAEKALKMTPEEKMAMIVCFDTSTDDEEEMEVAVGENGNISPDSDADMTDIKGKKRIVTEMDRTRLPEKSSKRQRLLSGSDNDDSADEFKPEKEDSDSDSISSGVDENDISDTESESEMEPSPVKKSKTSKGEKQRKKPKKVAVSFESPTITKSPSVSNETMTKLSQFSSPSSGKDKSEDSGEKVWPHLKLDWLKDHSRRDIKGRPVSHPNYDPRTLFVPESYKKNLTPAVMQWWEMKSQYFDTVLFFKVGKFYELYHMDAVIGVNELGLLYMKGDFAHSGFPEISYGRYSDVLIRKGYKVARVEQTETPQMMEERCKKMSKPTKFDRVVNREICRITTKGTRTFGFQESDAGHAENAYLLAITEKGYEDSSGGESEYGICFIDTSIGKFHIGQFLDDRMCSQLRTMMAHYPPSQILMEKGVLSSKTQKVLNSCASSALKEILRSGVEFWDSSRTLKSLAEANYFVDEEKKNDGVQWPEALKAAMDKNDPLCQTASREYDLAVKSLGACIWYIRECCIDEDILTMRNFEIYYPSESKLTEVESIHRATRKNMVLDGVTLRNLEILENNSKGTVEGTLFETVDNCSTLFGRRLLHQWLCSPLYNPVLISDRLDAIEDLRAIHDILPDITKLMRKLPDLERLLTRIHIQGLRRNPDHPDNRAIFFEAETYTKRKIVEFLSALDGFKVAIEVIKEFDKASSNFKSSILKQCVRRQSEGGLFPDLKDLLLFFDNAFDHEKAKKIGKIVPSTGVDEEFDSATVDIKEVNKEFDKYLQNQKETFKCKVTYFGTGRNRYQLEVPESAAKYATDEHELQSQRKGFKRYWTPTIKELLAKLVSAEEHRDAALKDIMRRIFSTFDKGRRKWESAVCCLGILDVLLSLTQYSLSCQGPVCRPQFIDCNSPYLEIREGQHPVLMKYFTGDSFIPNDISIGWNEMGDDDQEKRSLVLVTGPNMGGKSTLMRQAGLLVLMAQMGSYVPAEKVCLTPMDRIFTRLGASDNIASGESTFFVELSETSSILQHATKHSLVLLDELGRGTSTYDGIGIANAVVHELASSIQCLTLFSTHYHSLVDEYANHPNVKLGHMACMVENENEDPTQETITFLYKFIEGACPKSYGFNAAQLAGIPDNIIRHAYKKAKELECNVQLLRSKKLLRLSMSCKDLSMLQHLQKEIRKMNLN